MRLPRSMMLAGACMLFGCAASGLTRAGDVAITGLWGGERAGLSLTESGGSTEYDCAHGGLYAPVVPNRAGGFDVAGVHVREHGGPIREGEVPDSLPARYVGVVVGDRMTLRVVVGPDTLGPFALRLGAPPQLLKCL